jgi:Caspase domain
MAEKRSALIVATSEYDDARLAPLGGPGEDAEALEGVLGSTEIGSFDVQLALNSPVNELRTTLEAFFADRGRDDLLLVHFSGHGLKDDDGLLYLAARDTRIDRLMSTGIEAGWVNRLMTRCRSEKIALFLDCCFGGAFTTGLARRAGVDTAGVKETFNGAGRFVITASDAMQYSFESGQRVEGAEPQPSPFTSALVEGLRTGEADRNEDGFVSINELYDYLEDRVRELSPNQTPTKSAFNQIGDWVIAQSMRAPTIRILPASLQAQIKSDATAERTAAAFLLRDLIRAADPRVGEAARTALEQLTGDDSKFVSDTAARLFGELSTAPAPAPEADKVSEVPEAALPFKTVPTEELPADFQKALRAMEATVSPSPFETSPPPAQPAQPTPPVTPPSAQTRSEPGQVKPTLESALRNDPRMEAAAAQLAASAAAAPTQAPAPTPSVTTTPPATPPTHDAPASPSPVGPARAAAGSPVASPAPQPNVGTGGALWGPTTQRSEPPPKQTLWSPAQNAAPGPAPQPRLASSAAAGRAAEAQAVAAAAADAHAAPGQGWVAPAPGPLVGASAGPDARAKGAWRGWVAFARAALGTFLALSVSYVGYALEFDADLSEFASDFLGPALVIAAAVAAIITGIEKLVPALRIPGGALFRIVGNNRWLVAAALGVILFLVWALARSGFVYVTDFVGFLGGFLVAEWVVGRFAPRPQSAQA